jgi:hypothetical protein
MRYSTKRTSRTLRRPKRFYKEHWNSVWAPVARKPDPNRESMRPSAPRTLTPHPTMMTLYHPCTRIPTKSSHRYRCMRTPRRRCFWRIRVSFLTKILCRNHRTLEMKPSSKPSREEPQSSRANTELWQSDALEWMKGAGPHEILTSETTSPTNQRFDLRFSQTRQELTSRRCHRWTKRLPRPFSQG